MALSTLKVNRITSRALIDKIQIDDDLDLNGNEILNASKVTATKVVAQGASTLEAGLMTTGDKSKLDNIEANADVTSATNVEAAGAIMDADFEGDASKTSGYLKRTGTNATTSEPDYALDDSVVDADFINSKVGLLRSDGTQISFDNNTYLTTNEAIAVTGHVEGTGNSSITTTLTSSAITAQTPYTTVDGAADRLLVAVRRADGTYVLGQVAPNAVGGGGGGGGGTVGSFNSGQGINRIAGETGTAVTLQPNQFLIQNQPLVKGDGSNPAINGNDEVLLNRPSIGMLAKTTMNHLGTWIINTFGSGGGGGGGGGGTVNVTGLAIQFDIDGDGNLTLVHTGGITNNEFYIDTNSDLVAVVT